MTNDTYLTLTTLFTNKLRKKSEGNRFLFGTRLKPNRLLLDNRILMIGYSSFFYYTNNWPVQRMTYKLSNTYENVTDTIVGLRILIMYGRVENHCPIVIIRSYLHKIVDVYVTFVIRHECTTG